MEKDVFCTQKINETTFFETKHFRAVYNIRPIIRGHSLIIPKKHVLDIRELTVGELEAFRETLIAVLPKLLKAFNATSYNLSINAGGHAGMVVEHLHFHIVPRSANDIMQKKLLSFYQALHQERETYIRDVSKEVARLRKIFKYEARQKGLSQ